MPNQAYETSSDLTTLSPSDLVLFKEGMEREAHRVALRRLAKGLPPAPEFHPSDEEIIEAAAFAAARFPRPSRAGAARPRAAGSAARRGGPGR